MKKREEMLRDLHRRIDEYESDRRRKRAKVTKVAASVTPVCAAAVVGTGLWYSGAFKSENVKPSGTSENAIITEKAEVSESIIVPKDSNTKTVTAKETTQEEKQELASETAFEEKTIAEGDVHTDEPTEDPKGTEATQVTTEQRTFVTETTTVARTTVAARTTTVARTTATKQTTEVTTQQVGNGPISRDGDEPPEYRNIIQSYPIGASEDMEAPKEGTFAVAYPVTMAMRDYGDTADYRVCVELFKNSNGGTISDYTSLCAESKRLYGLGYISGVEGYTNAGYTTYFLWIQASRDQIKGFQPSSEYGYILMFPYSNQGTSETVTFNGINYDF